MKTIPVEQFHELTKALERQNEHEPIGLTNDAGTLAWVVRVPKELQDSEPNRVFFTEGPEGRVFVFIEAKHVLRGQPERESKTPVFGAGRGSLTIVKEDDEHLKDFQEYME